MDDLNDLVWTSSTPAQAAGAAAGRTSSPFASSFDLLAGSSTSGNRSYNASPLPRSLTPSASSAQAPQPLKPSKSTANGGGDAFASLLSLGPGTSSAPATGLSLAQRQAKIAEEQEARKTAETRAFQASGSFWDSLEGGGGGGLAPATAAKPAAAAVGLAPPARASTPLLTPTSRPLTPSSTLRPPTASPAPPPLPSSTDPWDELDVLASRPSSLGAVRPAATAPSDPFNFLEQSATSKPITPSIPCSSTSRGGDHSTGDDARGLMADGSDDDNDFMSAFNKPQPQQKQSIPASLRPKSSAARAPARPRSPPIHLIGQLVEMGFAPAAAREALASTESGEDVETAAAMLLSASGAAGGGGPRGGAQSDGEEPDEEFVERQRRRKEDEDAERRRRRRQGPSRSAVTADPAPDAASSVNGDLVAPLQDLLATTNLIGQSMFSKANALWSSSKQQVQKAYEERQRANASPAPAAGASNGRPKWMQEVAGEDAQWRERPRATQEGGFKDGDDEGEPPRPSFTSATAPSSRQLPPVQARPVPSLVEPEKQPRSFTSSRRHPPRPASPAIAAAPPSRPPSRQPSPAPVQLKKRNLVSAPSQALDAAAAHRTRGNEAFKLGQFGEAEAAYTAAIGLLPPDHLRLVPLYNNRAAARLKNGDHSAAVKDSSWVVDVVGVDYDASKEVPLPPELADLALGDALVKAISKRAAALEMGERWAQAKADWELVSRLDVCKGAARNAAMDGARRCKKMVDVLEGKTQAPAAPRPPPPSRPAAQKPKAKPAAPRALAADSASARLKQANAALESEDTQRSELKDSVDSRIAAWKTGKEANLRALIASLDAVLWPELGWQKVGLHELITDKQLKIRYTKAIGKLHPDKLAVGATTVEQRMIAGAVFGTLNEAWNASQK